MNSFYFHPTIYPTLRSVDLVMIYVAV